MELAALFQLALPVMLRGTGSTLLFAVASMVLGLALGGLITLVRVLQVPLLQQVARLYVSAFRGTPLLVQVFIIYYGLPSIGIEFSPLAAGILALTLNVAAYLSESLRGAVLGVGQGQWMAGKSLGLTHVQTLRHVVGPQALRFAAPSLSNSLISPIKDTSTLSVLAATEPMFSAKVLAQVGGLNILTDPIFSERASPVQFAGPKRHQPPGVALEELPRIDLVVASHNHYDHLDEASIRQLNAQEGGPPLFVVPLGLEGWLRSKGVSRAMELDWWGSHTIHAPASDVEVMLLPSQHWSSRGLHDRMLTLWGGFAVMAPDCHLFYAGDTGYSRDFTDIRERLAGRQAGGGFDIALLPIGAYEPRWFMA